MEQNLDILSSEENENVNTDMQEDTMKLQQTSETEILEQLVKQNERKYKKQRRFIIALCLITLIGTPTFTYSAMRFAQNRNQVVTKQNVIKNLSTKAKTEALNTEEIAEKAGKSVVEILNTKQTAFGEQAASAGSGVILSEDGYIVTNHHVVKDEAEIKVTLKSGEQYDAKLVGVDPRTDLAVIKIEATGLTPTEIADSNDVVVGEPAIAIGNSLGVLGGTVTKGIVSAIGRESNVGTYKLALIQTDAPVNEGNSGGGLFNEGGQLIGIVTQKASGNTVEGLGFAIPSNVMSDITKELIENGYVKSRPVLGIEVQQITERESKKYHLDGEGFYVLKSSNDALKRFDLLKEINGKPIKEFGVILDEIQGKKIGEKVTMKIVREGQEQEVEVVLKASEK